MANRNYEDIRISEASDVRSKPDVTLDLSASKDIYYYSKSWIHYTFSISIIILCIILVIILKANTVDLPTICQIIAPIITLVGGYWLGYKNAKEISRNNNEKR